MKYIDYAINASGIPILSTQAIEEYAQSLINDFSPLCLKVPRAFDIQSFVRKELGCRMSAVPLCTDGTIRAQTFFRDEFFTVQGEKGPCRVKVLANTIIINRDLLEQPGQARFALAHEAGHFLLHGDFYRNPPKSLSPEDEATLERQADLMAHSLLMNAITLEAYWGSMQVQLDTMYNESADLANRYAAAVFAQHYKLPRTLVSERMEMLGLVRRDRGSETV